MTMSAFFVSASMIAIGGGIALIGNAAMLQMLARDLQMSGYGITTGNGAGCELRGDAGARAILVKAAADLAALPPAPGSRTAEMIDEAVAWMDEQSTSIRVAAELEAQDL